MSDANAILHEVHQEVQRLEEVEREKEQQRIAEEEARNRILPRPVITPQQVRD